MKSFFKMVLATMLGFVLSYILILLLVFAFIFSMIAVFTPDDSNAVKPNSILEISLNYEIGERTRNNPFKEMNFQNFSTSKKPGLSEIIGKINKASEDPAIRGIFLNLSSVGAGMASIQEIRDELLEFRKTGKFIYTYGETFTQGAYFLASASDKIFLNPQGLIDFAGLRSEQWFFKNAFEKLEIQPQVIRHGKYKSAVEPFINDKMSPENREQIKVLLDGIWESMKNDLAKTRNIQPSEIQAMCDGLMIRNAQSALNNHLVDSLLFYDQVLDYFKWKQDTSIVGNKELSFVKLSKYSPSEWKKGERTWSKPKVALIYAAGGISGGKGDDESIGSDALAETIRNARKDTSIKAIVLRVNSPGGSALASDVILREVKLAKKEKPVVVSMGDVAASGGYYIACAADKIYAQPNTITGSIGVLGVFFNARELLKNKLGITIDTVKTAIHADFGSAGRPMDAAEMAVVKQMIENIYEVFIGHVSEGRKMTKEAIDNIGQGRVWSGMDAKTIGLVDALGGTKDALDAAAKLAKLEKYRVVELPEHEDPLVELMKNLQEETMARIFGKSAVGIETVYLQKAKEIIEFQGIQARMPFQISIY